MTSDSIKEKFLIKASPRGYGKNNYNKFNAKIFCIICGLENCFTITELCKYTKLAHQTIVKYIYKLMCLDRETFFA